MCFWLRVLGGVDAVCADFCTPAYLGGRLGIALASLPLVAEAAGDSTVLVVAKPRRRSALLVGIVLGVAALGTGWLLRGRAVGGAPPAERAGTLVHLEPFVINLADPEERSYLRIGIDLEIGDGGLNEASRAAVTARLRDAILGVLAQRGPEELLSAEGKNLLKQDLLQALRQRDPELQFEEVYFTEFLVQR